MSGCKKRLDFLPDDSLAVSLDDGVDHFFRSVLPAAIDARNLDRDQMEEMFQVSSFSVT